MPAVRTRAAAKAYDQWDPHLLAQPSGENMAFQGSLQFFGPLLWNKLDLSTRQLASMSAFKRAAGVKGTLGRLVGIFENRERKHRTYVYILIVTEVLEDWEDSVNIGRKRDWFKIDDAIQVLQCHKPVQATYFEPLKEGCLTSNGTPLVATIGGDLSPTYNINQSSVSARSESRKEWMNEGWRHSKSLKCSLCSDRPPWSFTSVI
ncbi:unnamed protein product [Coregonus sp. 'balchen']|nr:unnamed protein product [Coregonus sp. 'balchen']